MNEPQNGEKTIFQKIIDREIPAEILYEDDKTLAFLDNGPNSIGHTLVIPKYPAVNIFDVSPQDLAAVMETVRKIAPSVRDAVGAHGVHISSNHGEAAGQAVPHLHFHIIPRHNSNEFTFWPKIEYATGEFQATAQKIRHLIESE